MDLISLVLTLHPLAQAEPGQPLPLWWGRAAHALLLKTLRELDENLAQDIHDEEGVRPFTVSSLTGSFRGGQLDLQGSYSLRFSGLTAQVSGFLWQAAQPGGRLAPGQKVELDYQAFEVTTAAWEPAVKEWAATASYSELAASRLVNSQAAERHLALQFSSPTQFHSQGHTMPLPLPELVFGSLADRWNSFAPVAFPPELKRYAAECLAINRFELGSHTVLIKNGGKRIGAQGTIGYTTLNYDRYWMSLVQTLAAFALFAGVGAGVSMGMGQARQII